jgi:hypothetical protein
VRAHGGGHRLDLQVLNTCIVTETAMPKTNKKKTKPKSASTEPAL